MKDKLPGDWLFKFVPVFIVIVFVVVILGWICLGILGVHAVNALDGCTPALVTETKDGQTSTTIGCKK